MNKRFPLIRVSWLVLLVTIMYALPVRADVTEDQFDFEKLEDGTWSIRVRPDIFPSGEVIIPAYHEGIPVTAIADQGFNGQGLMTRVEIPETVTKLGEESFSCCPRLKCVNMPKSVAQIGRFCFSACQVLEEINIPEGVTQLEEYTFEVCTALKRIELPESLSQLGSHCFDGCEALANITLPSSLTNVKDMCFHGCKGLSSLELPKSLAYIGNAAFNGMELDRLTIHCSLTSKSDSKTIDSPCKVKEIVFACEIPYLPQSQFELGKGCKIIFSSEVRSIADHAFESSECQSFEFSEGLESIGDYAFKKTGLTSVEIPSTVRSIGTGAFVGCESLEKVEIEEGLTAISDGMFLGCTNLKHIKLPDSIESIGELAFYYCPIETIVLPSSLAIIGAGAFAADINPDEVDHDHGQPIIDIETISGGYKVDGLDNTRNLSQVTFPNKVVEIGDYAFCGMKDLNDFTLEASKIGYSAFYRCAALMRPDITVHGDIGDYAFKGCNSLKKFPKLDGTQRIGTEAFTCILDLSSKETKMAFGMLKIPDSVIEIGERAFADTDINTLILGEGLVNIGRAAFKDMSMLSTVKWNKCVKTIGDEAFENCYLYTTIVLPDGVESIGRKAFCTNISVVTIPESVKEIGEQCFFNPSIIDVLSPDPMPYAENLMFNIELAPGTLVLVPLGAKDKYLADASWSKYAVKERDSGKVTFDWPEDCSGETFMAEYSKQTDMKPEDVLELKVTGGLIRGGDLAIFGVLFKNCMSFDFSEARVECLPISEMRCFSNLVKLKRIKFPHFESGDEIPAWTFSGCYSLESVEMPSDIRVIGHHAFCNSSLKNGI